MTPRTTRPRFYYPGQIGSPAHQLVELTADESHHLLNVLRLRPGAPVDLFDAAGRGFFAELAEASKGVARVRVLEAHEVDEAPLCQLNLAVAILKRRAMDLMIEKLSELGVDALQPLLTKRCVALADIAPNEDPPPRWERIAVAAAKQCGRNRPLVILTPMALGVWLARGRPPAHTVFGHIDPEAPTLGEWLRAREAAAAPRWVAIGPEGGWTGTEVEAFHLAGFNPVRLGGLTLRAETAAIAAAAACQVL